MDPRSEGDVPKMTPPGLCTPVHQFPITQSVVQVATILKQFL